MCFPGYARILSISSCDLLGTSLVINDFVWPAQDAPLIVNSTALLHSKALGIKYMQLPACLHYCHYDVVPVHRI